MSAHGELLQHELDMERREMRADPSGEQLELALLYEQRGVPAERAELLARDMMRDPDLALEAHAREELGIDPDELGSPSVRRSASFASFAVGAFVPFVPWFDRRKVGGAGVAWCSPCWRRPPSASRWPGCRGVRPAGRRCARWRWWRWRAR